MRVSRREFFGLMVAYTATTGLLGIVTKAPNSSLVRPPGAFAHEEFLQMCIRCGACTDVCPVRTIELADFADGLRNIGTPKLVGHCILFKGLEDPNPESALLWKRDVRDKGQEETCFECIKSCPTGALHAVNVSEVRMGIAVVDREICSAWNYGHCTFPCVDVCPVDAIFVTAGPEVDLTKCVGCNQCDYICARTNPPGSAIWVRAITEG